MLLNWLYPPLIYLSQFRFINEKRAGFQKIEKFRNIFCNASPIPDKPENIPPILISKLSKDCLIFSQILETVNKVLFVISQRLIPKFPSDHPIRTIAIISRRKINRNFLYLSTIHPPRTKLDQKHPNLFK